MSSTSNAQDLLVNVFRPTYRWDSNTGFVPSLTISNVSEIITGSLKTDLLVVSDTGNNTYIGSNAGLYASNTAYNVGLGYQAMGGAINSSNNVAVGYYALDGAKNSTSNVVLGSYSGLTNSNGGVRNVLIGPNVTVGTGSGNILIGSDISLASGTNRFQLGKLLYGDLSSGYIGVNTNDPKSAFDVSGTTLIRGKLGIQTVPNPKYSLDVNGSIFANDRFFGGKGTVAEPVYSFDDVSESGMYVPQASEGYGNGAFAIAVNQKPAAIFSSNAVNFFQNLDVSGTFSACNVELAAFSVEAGSRSAPTITFASNRADGFYHLADTSGFAVVTMGQDRMMFLESGDISSSRILGSDISLAGAIFTTAGCNVVGGVTLSNGNVILTGTATNSNLLVPGWIRNNETAPIVDISGGVVRAVRFRAQDGTATAPAYSFLNDASSGMRLVTRNTIAFDTSGTQRMCISAGFVGIGTANPRVALEVVGDVSATTYNGPGGTAGAPHYTFSDDRTTGVFFPGANMIGMTAGGTERMRISNGFIGIGTTPSASSALDVSGVFRIIGANGNITFNNGTIDVSGTPLVSTTGAFSNAATTTSNYIGGVTLSNFDVSLMSNGQFRTMTGTSNYIGGVTLSNFDVSLMSSGRFRTMTGTSNYIGGVTLSNFDVSLIGQGRILGPSASSNSIGGFGLSNGRIQTNTTDTFVVVTGLTPSIVTSTDGVTWTTRDANTVFTTSGRGVAWNGTLWVATGVGTNTIATSSDGLTWTGRDSASNIFSGGGRGIAWNGSLWLAVGSGTNNTIATSPDGINWTGRGTAITNAGVGRAAAWNGSLWVVVSAGGNTIVTSPDGINWTTRDAASLITSAYCVAWNGRLWVVGGTGGSALLTSSDGITWTTRSSDFTTVVGVAWNGSFWVAVGSGTNTIATSPDGVTWTSRVTSSSIFSAGGNGGVSWNGRVWTAVAADVAKIVTSPDGVTWTQQYTATVYGTASRRYVLPTITSAEFDANGGSLTYSGSLLGSNVASSNSIGGVTLSNFDLCMASTGRILGMPTISNYIGGVTLSNFDLCMASTGRILGMPTISNYIGGVTLSNFDVSLIGQGRILGFPTSSNRIGGVTLSNSNVFTGNGSATIPTYAFTNDPSTGLHLATGSRLAFDTSGVQRMVIVDSSIGIGTSNPRWTVDISGSGAQRIQVSGQDAAINLQDQRVADPFILFQNASNYGVYSSNALPFWLWQSNVVRMCISGVFTGIGTTAPTSTLDIKGATTPLLRLSDGTNRNPIIELNRNDGASFGSTVFVDWRMQATANGANLQFVRGSTTGTLTALHVDGTNGLVGIKTIGPATTLDVSHDGTGPGGAVGFFLRGASGAGIGLNISNGTKSLDLGIATSSGAWAGNSITGDAVLRTTAPGRLLFNANGSGGTAALTISGDKVGIGCFNGDSSSGLIHLDISGATRFGRSINGTNNLILIADTASGLPVTRHGIGILNVPTGSGNGGGDLAFNTYNDAGAPLNTAPPAMVIKRSNGNVGILCNAPQYQLDVSGTIGAHSNEYTMYIPGTASGTTTYTIPTGFSHVHVTAVGAGGGGGGGNGGSGGGGGGGGGAGQTVQQLVPSVTGTTFQVGFGSGGAGGSASSSGGAGTDTTVTIGVYTIKADGGQGGGGASTGSLGGVGGGGFGTTYGGGGGGGGGGSSPNTAGGGGVGTLVSGASGLAGSVGAGGAGGSGGGTINSAARSGLAGGGGGGGGPLGGAGGFGGASGSPGGQGCGGGGGGGASGNGGGGGRGYAILKFLR